MLRGVVCLFGYLQIEKSELKVKDFEKYRAIYCSLCRQLGADYSVFARLILSYDCTFFAVVLLSLEEGCTGFKKGKCKCNPLKSCTYCIKGEEAFKAASALSVISAYYKLKDDIYDSGFFKRLICYMALPFVKRWRNKAAKSYREIDEIVYNMLSNQQLAEKDSDCCIDKACEPTAVMLSSVLNLYAKNDLQRQIFEQMGYHLGRWIYLCDAINDLESDIKKKSFNPLKKYVGNVQYFEQILNQATFQATSAYNLYEPKKFKEILDNLFYFGLNTTKEKILKKKKGGDDIEKSI